MMKVASTIKSEAEKGWDRNPEKMERLLQHNPMLDYSEMSHSPILCMSTQKKGLLKSMGHSQKSVIRLCYKIGLSWVFYWSTVFWECSLIWGSSWSSRWPLSCTSSGEMLRLGFFVCLLEDVWQCQFGYQASTFQLCCLAGVYAPFSISCCFIDCIFMYPLWAALVCFHRHESLYRNLLAHMLP